MKTFRIAKVLIKSMFKKPATLMYPVVPREWQERTRGSIDIHEDACILCGICGRRCPADAIEVDRKGGTWTIHRMQCIQCGECVAACPKKCLDMNNQYTEPQAEKVVDTYEIELKKDDPKGKAPAGDLTCNKEECVFCGLCAKVCPADALKVDRKEKIWEVDKEACAKCGACVEKCPKKCLSMGEAEAPKAEEKSEAEAPAASDDDKLTCNLDECIYCGLCAKNCPCDALTVDRKEKIWKVDDEACVKCGACLEKCPKKCLTIGEAPAEAEEAAPEDEEKKAAKAVVNEEDCIYCGMCENKCPEEAISAEMDNWTLDEEKCIGCGICVDACPADALKVE